MLYGWAGNLHLLGDWWTTVRTSTAPNLLNQDNVSLAGMFTKWMGPDSAAPTLTLLAIALLVGLTGIVIAARAGLPAPEPLEAALLLTLIPLISPQGWDYVFLIATPAVMLIIDRLSLLPRGLRIATIAAIAVVALEHLRRDGSRGLRGVHGELRNHALLPCRDRGAHHAAIPPGGIGDPCGLASPADAAGTRVRA